MWLGRRYTDKILDYLEKHSIPNLRRDLDVVKTLTPFGFRDDLNSHLGSAFSVEPILTQSAWFRPHNRDDKIGNMYIVGAGTHPRRGRSRRGRRGQSDGRRDRARFRRVALGL